jgi:hypothetical protein
MVAVAEWNAMNASIGGNAAVILFEDVVEIFLRSDWLFVVIFENRAAVVAVCKG